MAFTIPARLTTELDAVNMLLAAKNIAPVESLVDNTDSEVEMAMLELNVADLEVQGKGWSFNEDLVFTLSPDATTGEITLPDETLRVNGAYWSNNGQWINAAERQGKLYDRVNQTFVWTVDVQVDITTREEFEDLPQVARLYIAVLAAHRFQAKGTGSQVVMRITSEQVLAALVALEHHEDMVNPKNEMANNIHHQLTIRGGSMRRNRT